MRSLGRLRRLSGVYLGQIHLPSEVDVAAAGNIAASRRSTRSQRQVEREKYNQIYRVVDLTLDDVCEQSMPNVYYGFVSSLPSRRGVVLMGRGVARAVQGDLPDTGSGGGRAALSVPRPRHLLPRRNVRSVFLHHGGRA